MYQKFYGINVRAITRVNLAVLCAGAAMFLAACKTTEPAVQAPVITQTPQPVQVQTPAPPPPLSIATRPVSERMNEALVRSAGNHAVLMSRINLIPTEEIRSADHMNQTMDGLSQVFSPGIGPALIGYGALIGAQNSEFVEGVLETARYQGLDSVVYQLYVDPNYVASMPGASFAGAEIQNAWASDIAAIGRSGDHIKTQSYALQKQSAWKKLKSDARGARLEALGRAKSMRFTPPRSTTQRIAEAGSIRAGDMAGPQKRQQFWQAYGRSTPPRSQTFSTQYNGAMHRKALTLSALEILGATSAESSQWIENYMTSPRLTQCVNTARLNTEQCIAAGHFKYEDAFCIAQHELTEISNCLTGSAL